MIVETKYLKFPEGDDSITLESGKDFGPVTVAYETYGNLNEKKDNVILVIHALSGDAHAAGVHSKKDKKSGWWDPMIGPGKAFDTDKYYVICSNVFGGCKGTTGPNSLDPSIGKPYGLSFPVVTMKDMVNIQKKLLDFLEIKSLVNVTGGSMGGMQVLEWIIQYPEMVKSACIIAATAKLSTQSIAFDEVGRHAIMSDVNWNKGNYYEGEPPSQGLAIARMIGHITYLSDESMYEKFGRRFQDREKFGYDFTSKFEVESYLHYQGDRFVERFDANSYLYLTKAMDYFDIAGKYGSLKEAFKDVVSKVLVVSFTSDWLFPTYQSKDIVSSLMALNKDVSFCEIDSLCGHDAFLLEYDLLGKLLKGFVENVEEKDVLD